MMVNQPDGTQLSLTSQGDEYRHYLVTDDGVAVVRSNAAYYYACFVEGSIEASSRLAHSREFRDAGEQAFVDSLSSLWIKDESIARRTKAMRQMKAKAPDVPVSGKVHVPVLLVQYADAKFSSINPKAEFEKHINGDGTTSVESGSGSVKEFFEDQSEGKFSPLFDIIGPITLDHDMKYYGANDKKGNDLRPRQMVSEACVKAYSLEKVDFTPYDNNKDGYVDILYVIYAGYGEASYPDMLENTVWPHQWELESPLSLGSVKVNRYACNNELDGYSGTAIDGIGTFCHEFSHCLGLPDIYDTSPNASGFGLSAWSIMDYGCYNNNGHTPCGYTGYEKDFLGWKSLVELDSPGNVTLTALSDGGEAYKIVNEANPDEYYVVEHHRKSGWDKYIPAEGMLVMHVDYDPTAWVENRINNNPAHQRMTIIPADGKLTKGTLADDTYPGTLNNTSLTSTSNPAAKVYTGGFMYKDITNISTDGQTVTFSFMQGALSAPHLQTPEEVTESGFTVRWTSDEDFDAYELKLELLEENPYLLAEDFAKVRKGSSDISDFLDSYTHLPGWLGYQVCGLEGGVRIGSTSSIGALQSPFVPCDSGVVTLLVTVKKSVSTDKSPYLILGVGDESWGGEFKLGYLKIDDDEWVTCWAVIESVGSAPCLYIASYDDTQVARLDIDDICMLSGDYSDELQGEDSQLPKNSAFPKRRMSMQHGPDRMEAMPLLRSDVARLSPSLSASSESLSQRRNYTSATIYTAQVSEPNYTFSNLDGGIYRCRVRGFKEGVYSLYSDAVEVQLVDSMLPMTGVTPSVSIDRDSVYLHAPDSIAVYYTVDGSRPTAYSTRYTAPFVAGEKMTIRAMARQKGHRSSPIVNEANWFMQDGATYRILSTLAPEVLLSEAVGGNGETDYAGHYTFGDEVCADGVTYALTGIDSHAFRNATALRSIHVEGDGLSFVGDSIFFGCTSLSAVVWDTNTPIASAMFDEDSYGNLLLYLPTSMSFAHSLVDKGAVIIVRDGRSGAVSLMNDKPFYCPKPFVADKVSYQRDFSQVTGMGTSAGWETIMLPFDVKSVAHSEKGSMAPFGVSAPNNFWLASPEGDSFVAVTDFCANTPYIISMPNNAAYGDYAVGGAITFSAENATIYATTDDLSGRGNGFVLNGTYDVLAPSPVVYALNVDAAYEGFAAGSVFVSNRHVVPPFSAYVTAPSSASFAPYYRIALADDSDNAAPDVMRISVSSHEGVVYISTPEPCWVKVYDATGRRICTVACVAGVNEVRSLAEGMYIIEKTKVYVRR